MRQMRKSAGILVLLLLAAACGGSDSGTEQVAPTEEETLAPEAAQATTPPMPTTTQAEPTETTDPSPEPEPLTSAPELPAPGLPVVNEFVHDTAFTQPYMFMTPAGPAIFAGATTDVVRIDLDSGEIHEESLWVDDGNAPTVWLPRPDPNSPDRVVMGIDAIHNGSVDSAAALDSRTGELLAYTKLNERAIVVGSFVVGGPDFGFYRFDTEALTVGEPFPYGQPGNGFDVADGKHWIMDSGGAVSVYDAETDEPVANFEVDMTYTPGTTTVAHADERGIWILDTSTARVFLADPADYSVAEIVDLHDYFAAESITFSGSSPARPIGDRLHLLAEVLDDGDRWALLVEVDAFTGDVWAVHTITNVDTAMGWDFWVEPRLLPVDERLFVQDHLRRIVEVDLEELGRFDAPWTLGELSHRSVLSAEEEAVGAVAAQYFSGEPVPHTDPSLPMADQDFWPAKARGYGIEDGATEVEWVSIKGDRAAAGVGATNSDAVNERVMLINLDGEWHIDTEAMCLVGTWYGNPCEL